jgi:hypothetical protein
VPAFPAYGDHDHRRTAPRSAVPRSLPIRSTMKGQILIMTRTLARRLASGTAATLACAGITLAGGFTAQASATSAQVRPADRTETAHMLIQLKTGAETVTARGGGGRTSKLHQGRDRQDDPGEERPGGGIRLRGQAGGYCLLHGCFRPAFCGVALRYGLPHRFRRDRSQHGLPPGRGSQTRAGPVGARTARRPYRASCHSESENVSCAQTEARVLQLRLRPAA